MFDMLWKKIPGFDGYEASYDGFIRNSRGRILKGRVVVNGYIVSSLKDQKAYKHHRLVALAWIPNPEEYPVIDHISEDKTNNCVNNLRWCTQKMNREFWYQNHPERRAVIKPLMSEEAKMEAYGAKSVKVNGVLFLSAGSAAKMIAEIEGKKQSTISKEIRKMLAGKRGEWDMYGKYSITHP